MSEGQDTIATGESNPSHSWEYEIPGDTYSVSSSITRYRIENGRRYHAYKDGLYWAPNDETQNEALDITHHKFLLVLEGKLHLAPLPKDIEKVLDLGTGTGIWAIDFADEYPSTAILGTDLSPIQPSLVPPNCRFEVEDAADEWVYPPECFDLVHIRSLFGSIEDWPALYKQAYQHLKPGGYIEQIEISIDFKSDDGTIPPESSLSRLTNLLTEAGRITGRTFRIADMMKAYIEEAGFVNVVERVFKTPIGGWPADHRLRELGQWALLGFDTGLEGNSLATFTRVLNWTVPQVHIFLAKLRGEVRDRKIHSYNEIKVVYAQKPLSAT